MSPEFNPFEVASRHATRQVPVVGPDTPVRAIKNLLDRQKFDCASHIAVCEGERFAGVVRIEDMMPAADDVPVHAVMDPDPPTIKPGADQEKAAWHAIKHNEAAIAVVDEQGHFSGMIPPYQLLTVLLQEHDEDMARLGGFLKQSSGARMASEEPLHRRFWHRLPWLLLGLAGAIFAADILGWFEAQLQEKVLLAFFIPGIVYLADAVGTQTETVVVRGLSVGVSIRRILRLELLTGLGIGITLAAVAAPVVYLRWHDADVAISVGLALLATCSIATLVAMTLPWLLDKCRVDPAFGSGPLATVIQDLLSIFLYFLIARWVLL
jgi:magnesium transporter